MTRAEYIRCRECDGIGAFSDRHPNDPDAREYACSHCDDGEIPGAAERWDAAVALWNATPPGDAGDWGCSQMSAVAEKFGDDLMDAICGAMAAEPAQQRIAA